MNAIETETFILPSYWASYLINGDASGLEDGDQEACDAWQERNPDYYITSCDGEPYFAHRNDAGTLPGDVLEYTAIKRS